MAILVWPKTRRFNTDFARHAEMNSEPAVARKLKQHSFAADARIQQLFADKAFLKRARVRSAKNAVPRMQADIDNLVPTSRIPLLTIPFDLRQLRHGGEYVAQSCCRSLRAEHAAVTAASGSFRWLFIRASPIEQDSLEACSTHRSARWTDSSCGELEVCVPACAVC